MEFDIVDEKEELGSASFPLLISPDTTPIKREETNLPPREGDPHSSNPYTNLQDSFRAALKPFYHASKQSGSGPHLKSAPHHAPEPTPRGGSLGNNIASLLNYGVSQTIQPGNLNTSCTQVEQQPMPDHAAQREVEFDLDLTVDEFIKENKLVQKEFTFDELRIFYNQSKQVAIRFKSRDMLRINLITEDQLRNVGYLLVFMHSLKTAERLRAVQTSLNIPGFGSGFLTMVSNPDNHFPETLQAIALGLHDKYDGENWGLPVLQPQSDDGPNSQTSKRKTPSGQSDREDTEQASKHKKPKPANTKNVQLPSAKLLAPDNHPIFGLNGIMHHIIVRRSKDTTSYSLDPNFIRKSADVFGNNGFTVGQCWPLQIAALRDGVHGARVAGIAGNSEGAYSIVVGGTLYKEVDGDHGDEIFYSAPLAYDKNTAGPEKKESTGAACLLKSIQTQKPVRVLRTHAGKKKWAGCPKIGLRYDGLYRVLKSAERTNEMGSAFISFHLVRIKDQVPIDTTKPNYQQVKTFEKVQLYY